MVTQSGITLFDKCLCVDTDAVKGDASLCEYGEPSDSDVGSQTLILQQCEQQQPRSGAGVDKGWVDLWVILGWVGL